jgi:hypothetical protein
MNRRFTSDFQLPIPVRDAEYIQYYIDLFDDVFDTKRKYALFLDLHERLGGDEPFFQYSQKIQQEAIDIIKKSPAYEAFIHDTRDLFSGYKWLASKAPKGQVYKGINDGKRFLSIDLVKANYQALRYYTRHILQQPPSKDDIILGTSTFNEFIHKFTDEEYFMEAKKFRQVIFGNMNPKRQQTIQKYIINEVLAALLNNNLLDEAFLKDYTSDEIVFEITDDTPMQEVRVALEAIQQKMGIELHVDTYTLRWLKKAGDQADAKGGGFFVRELDDGSVDFKGIEASLMPQAYKRYKGISELQHEDLLFYASNGMLAKYLQPIQWK